MNRPSSARRIWSISAAVPASRGTTSVAANRRIAATSGVVGERVDDVGIPAGLLQRRDQSAGPGLGLVDGGAVVGAVLGQAERLPQPRHRLLAAEQLPGPQDRQHQVELGLPRRCLAEDVQAVADLDVLDLAQPAVDVQQHVVERVLVGPFGRGRGRGPSWRPASASRSAGGWRAACRGRARRCWRARRAAAPTARCRRSFRRGPSAG